MELPNSNYINKLSGNNEEFKAKITAIIKRELPEEIETYQNQIKNKNYLIAAGCVHKLKHKVSILGLEKSYYIAEQFENNLKENSTHLQTEFEKILNLMQDFVKEL